MSVLQQQQHLHHVSWTLCKVWTQSWLSPLAHSRVDRPAAWSNRKTPPPPPPGVTAAPLPGSKSRLHHTSPLLLLLHLSSSSSPSSSALTGGERHHRSRCLISTCTLWFILRCLEVRTDSFLYIRIWDGRDPVFLPCPTRDSRAVFLIVLLQTHLPLLPPPFHPPRY